MKKLFLALSLSVCSLTAIGQSLSLPEFRYTPTNPPQSRSSYSLDPCSNPLLKEQIPLPEFNYDRLNTILENGWYEATVEYSNANTYTKSTYTLDVKIHNDRVVTISFGNEGSLHTGSNNSGYTYSGGDLTFYQNQKGEIVSADTTVKIYKNGSYTYFKIELE